MLKNSDLIISLSNIGHDDKDLVGEKAAGFGEMLKHGFPLPDGFVITQNAYHQFAIKHKLPDELIKEIFRAYKRLEHSLKDATIEIIPGLKEKDILTVKGEAVFVEKIKSIWAHNPSPIVVRKIPQTSNLGVMFTINPTHNDKTKIAIYEKGSGNHYEVLKRNLKITFKAVHKGTNQNLTDKQIIKIASLGKKLQQFFYFPQEVHFAIERKKIFITKTKQINHMVSKLPSREKQPPLIEKIPTLNPIHGKPRVIVQKLKSSRPHSKINNRKVLIKGNSIYPGIATGHLRIIQNLQDINKVLRGEVVVIPYHDIVMHPIVKAGAIVATDEKLYELPHLTLGPYFSGKPTVITRPEAAKILRDGTVVTVNGKNGEVYTGSQWQ